MSSGLLACIYGGRGIPLEGTPPQPNRVQIIMRASAWGSVLLFLFGMLLWIHTCCYGYTCRFSEMPTNNFIESSFWNFDALFQPQQHPARDAHDTFFLKGLSAC